MHKLQIIQKLKQNAVIAYPTEAVFGLGCNPQSEHAVRQLLQLKNRPEEKGLILIAPSLELFADFVDFSAIPAEKIALLEKPCAQPTTWIVPAKKNVPTFLRGQFSTLAIRLCQHPDVKMLCEACGFPLVSTSANLTGQPPCKTAQEVQAQFGLDFPVLMGEVGNAEKPSEIRDLFSNKILRQG